MGRCPINETRIAFQANVGHCIDISGMLMNSHILDVAERNELGTSLRYLVGLTKDAENDEQGAVLENDRSNRWKDDVSQWAT